MSDESVILINLLKVKPGKQDALIALLKQNTDTVVRTLHGWKTTAQRERPPGRRLIESNLCSKSRLQFTLYGKRRTFP